MEIRNKFGIKENDKDWWDMEEDKMRLMWRERREGRKQEEKWQYAGMRERQQKENDNALSITTQFNVFFSKRLMKIISLVSCINPELAAN